MPTCPKCHVFYFLIEHKCPPEWLCIVADEYLDSTPTAKMLEEDGDKIYAGSPADAAKLYTEQYHARQMSWPQETTVYVFDGREKKLYRYVVDMQPVPEYSIHWNFEPQVISLAEEKHEQ